MAGDTFRDAVRGALDADLLANPSITWPHKDTLNTGVKPDASTGYFKLEFPGGDESQYTFGAPGFNDWQEIGQITVRAVVRQNAGKVERDRAETFIETIRAAFRGRGIPIGARAIRIKRTGAMGGGQDEAGMWVESIGLEYELFNIGWRHGRRRNIGRLRAAFSCLQMEQCAMDSANKQTAVVAEVTQGTTPTSPGFKLLRDSSVTGSPQRGAQRSPERRPDRMAANMVSGLASYPKSINMPLVRDAGSDVLLESLLCGAWATNVLKNASVKKPFTLEEKYEGGATDPYRRLAGCLCDSLRLSIPLAGGGDPGTLTFAIKALMESTGTAALGSSTYSAPTPGDDPVSSNDITVNDLFGITTPKIMSLDMTISNAMREKYAFGSPNPFDLGLGAFDVTGQVQLYFTQLTDYSTFVNRQSGLTLDLLLGSVEDHMDQIQLNNVDVWNPDVTDPGTSGDNMVTLQFGARYAASDSAVIVWTRNVGLVP